MQESILSESFRDECNSLLEALDGNLPNEYSLDLTKELGLIKHNVYDIKERIGKNNQFLLVNGYSNSTSSDKIEGIEMSMDYISSCCTCHLL